MTIDDLIPGLEASRMAGFKTSQAFYAMCERVPGAPRIVAISRNKRFVPKAQFSAWLQARLEGQVAA